MSKYKPSKLKQVFTPNANAIPTGSADANLDSIIAMLGHTDAHGKLHSKIDFSTSDKDGLEGVELVFRQAMQQAIMDHDIPELRKAYVAMERILGINMETYERFERHFPAEGQTLKNSPSEMCLSFKAWPIFLEIFKLSTAHDGLLTRMEIDSPLHLLFRLGSWLIDSDLQSEYAGITQLAKDVVDHFLITVKPAALANGLDLKAVIESLLFLKKFPPLEQVFWTQYAATPA